MKRITLTTCVAVLLVAAALCLPAPAQPAPPVPPATKSLHAITLPAIPTELPPGPSAGRETVGTACTFCHSARYVLNQPAFPRQTWLNEVNKMRTTFGAPIAEQQVPAIVDYLVAIRGAEPPATKP